MKCPYCRNEMEQGFIQSPQEISWKKASLRSVQPGWMTSRMRKLMKRCSIERIIALK